MALDGWGWGGAASALGLRRLFGVFPGGRNRRGGPSGLSGLSGAPRPESRSDRAADAFASPSAGTTYAAAPPRAPIERTRHGAIQLRVAAPAVEPARGRERVEQPRRRERLHELALLAESRDALGRMPARIEQHVGERIPHLLRRLQQAQVISLEEHRPGAPQRPVHRAREPRRKRHHPAPERIAIVGLDDQVRVIVLDRVVDEPEIRRARRPSGTTPRPRARRARCEATRSRAAPSA